MSEFRILDSNFVFDPATLFDASSEEPSFPAENVAHFHRAKLWESSGNFVIDATNNKIDFKESGGGAELHATISSGTYTPTTLAAAIDAALTAAGAVAYTVSYSTTTGKWTITSAGAYLSILWLTGTNTAVSVASTIGFDPAADSTGGVTYTGSMVAIHTEEWLHIDLGSAEAINSFAAVFDRRLGHGFTASAVLKLQGNATNVWTAPSVDTTLAIDEDYDIATHFYSSSQTYRHWRVKIVDPRNPNLYVSLPTLFLSLATQLTQTPQLGFTLEYKDLSQAAKTPYGHKYTDIYPTIRLLKFDYKILLETDLKTLEQIYERVGSVTPIMLCLDPTATVFDKDRFAVYGYLGEGMGVENPFYNYFNTGLQLEEAV